MQTNYELPGLGRRAIVLPLPARAPAAKNTQRPLALTGSTRSLLRVHTEAARTEARENVVWLALAVGALVALGVCFWL